MSTKNSDYWAGRFKDLEKAQNRKAVSAVVEIERQYNRAIKDVESKIRTWYQRFADNNGITMAEARKWLDAKQLKELHWDVNEYIKYGKDNEINQQWMKELENASAKMHISRLQALELEIRQSLEKLTADQLGTTEGTLEDVYRTGYYHTAYEIAKGTQIGTDIAKLDQRTVEKILQKPWAPDGKNFSDRIWENKNKLLGTVHSELSKNILTGADPQKAIDEIAKKMNTSKHNAGRLVMTEEAYFNSLSQGDMFKELDVEKYEIVATLDSHTSEICQDMDGKVFPMSEYESGVTAPPFHVYCRSTTAPWFPEDYGVKGERAARDTDDDKTYTVPADMTYKEWKKRFVDQVQEGGSDEITLTNDTDSGTIKTEIKSSFDEAKTVTEAVAKTGDYAKTVDLNGVKNVDSLNSLNRALDRLTSKYNINELEKIEVFSRGNALAKANYRHILVKRSYMNKPSDSVENWSEVVEDCKRKIEDAKNLLSSGTLTSKGSIRNWEKYLNSLENEIKFVRYGVSDSYKDNVFANICHEFGHVIADQYCGQINGDKAWKDSGKLMYSVAQRKQGLISDAFKKAKDTGDIYKISKYASTNSHEFFAEVFSARELGEKLPDYITEMLEEVIK